MKLSRIFATIALLTASMASVCAQGFYDDDIYYDADKAKKEKAAEIHKKNYVPNTVVDYPGADTYVIDSGSTRDVDEYNRRTQTPVNVVGTLSYNDDGTQTFTFTKRIERYHNPQVVSGSDDDELQYLYYTDQEEASQTDINIYLNGYPYYPYNYNSYWYGGYYSPYYNWWAYDPWYYPASWSWGWGPSWSWSWGWGGGWLPPTPPGRPHPGGPGAPGGGWAHYAPGAARPHYGSGSVSRPSNGYRYGNPHNQAGQVSRPTSPNVSSGNFTPGYETRTGRRPGSAGYGSVSTSGSNHSGSSSSGYRSGSSSNRGGSSSSGYRSGSSSNRSSSSSGYRSGSSGSSRSSSGSHSSGGSRGGGGGRGRH